MFRRQNIQYGNFLVRLVCCSSVALAVANAVHFNMLQAWETLAQDLVLGGDVEYGSVTEVMQVFIVFCCSIVLCLPRIERPLFMVGCGSMLGFVYMLLVVAVSTDMSLGLPVVSPLLGVFGATAVLETMAWSEERTKRKKLERLEIARQRFVDMLVHDLRRRMSSVLTVFSLLEKKVDTRNPETIEMMSAIRASAERVVIQVNDLLDIRKIEEEKMVLQCQRISLQGLLDEILKEHRAVSDLVGIGIDLAESEETNIYVDKNIFSRVIANLLWNALQYAPRGTRIEVGWICSNDMVLYVANRGKDIPPEQQAQLFQAFVSKRGDSHRGTQSGTGLGLAFCKLALELHGGNVRIESPWGKYGDGVKMLVTLPGNRMVQ